MMLVELCIASRLLLELLVDVVYLEVTIADDIEYVGVSCLVGELQGIDNLRAAGDDGVDIRGIATGRVEGNLLG